MAGRKIKLGIEYFPLEVSVFSDMKIRRLIRDCGGQALCVYINLLCSIYKDGYFIKWIEDIPFLISEDTKLEEEYVLKVVKSCLNHGLFSKELFEKNGVLTSKGIQERYKLICELSRRKIQIDSFSLISSEEIGINSEEISISSEEIGINSDLMQQRKVKEIKVNSLLASEENCIDNYSLSFDGLVKEFSASSDWQATLTMHYPQIKTVENCQRFMLEFCDVLRKADQFPINLNKAKNRFAGWLKLELSKEPKEQNGKATFEAKYEKSEG